MNRNMDNSKKAKSGIRPGVLIGVTAVVLVVGGFVSGRMLGWFGGKRSTNGGETASAPADSGTPQPATVVPTKVVPAPGRTAHKPATNTTPVAVAPPALDPGTPGEMVADWSQKLDDILGSSDDESKKADLLLAMWKRLPEEGQVETMQHISNLLPDEKFSSLVPAFTNAATPEAVLDILMTDALNRPNAMKLPALLDVARTPSHPKAEEARDILEVFVDHNYGEDWPKWEKALQDWLKENPDEPEPGK
jgi:hypothetical protein